MRAIPSPWRMPPWIWPSTSVGLIARPTSWAATTRRTFTVPSSTSTSTSATWAPKAYVSYGIPWPSASSGVVFGSYAPCPSSTQPRAPSGSSPSSTTDVVSPSRATTRPSSTSSVASGPASAIVSSWRRRSSAASRVAFPDTNVWRDAEVLPASRLRSVSGPTRSIRATGTPRASAAIWARIVFEPCPMSVAPENSTMCPSARTPTSISEGLGSDVLPMPYHMAAIPTPRRTGAGRPLVVPRGVGAHRRPAGAKRLQAGGQARARGAARWEVAVRSPARSALRSRNSRGSMSSWPARSSISASWAMADLRDPEPAEGAGRRAVGVDRPARARDRRHRVRPRRMDRHPVGDGRAPGGVGAGVEVGVDADAGEAAIGAGAECRARCAPGAASSSRPSTRGGDRGPGRGGRGGARRAR